MLNNIFIVCRLCGQGIVKIFLMEISNTHLDSQCLHLIELLAEIEEKRIDLEKHMKNGFLDLAKARYAIGINKVSKLHYPKEMMPNFRIECRYVEL